MSSCFWSCLSQQQKTKGEAGGWALETHGLHAEISTDRISDHQVNTHLKRQDDGLNASPEQRVTGQNLSVPRITPTAHKCTACVRDQENTRSFAPRLNYDKTESAPYTRLRNSNKGHDIKRKRQTFTKVSNREFFSL